jgi:exo-beta-1,3-glucanase (GH17 family)
VTFLQDIYADGAQGSFDGVGDHPYSYPFTPAGNPQGAWSEMGLTSPSLRSVMAANADSAKKIWITEYGAPTTGSNSVSQANQSTELTDAINEARQTSWIASFYIYTWSDQIAPTSDGFGMLDQSGSQKPAYSAVAGLTS